jgi:putative membrane protein
MNANTQLQQTVEQNKPGLKLISKSASATLGTALVAVGLLMTPARANAGPPVCAADNNFIQSAAQGGMTEVKLGALASTSGTREDVREFGQRMVKDHTSINGDLKALATERGVSLPDSLDSEHQGMVDKMSALSGSDFDNAYISCMIKDHKTDAKAFKAESAATKDTDIKSFVDKTIPVVHEHLKLITAMNKQRS